MNGAEVRAEVNGPEIIITAGDGVEAAESTQPEEARRNTGWRCTTNVTGEQPQGAGRRPSSAFVDAPAVYQNAPSFAYVIGDYTRQTRNGTADPARQTRR